MTINCLESLASAQYKKILFNALPKDWGFSGFATEFGDFLPVAKRGCELGYPLIKVQGVWRIKHDFGIKQEKEALKLAEIYQRVAENNPETEIQFSPFCEHNWGKEKINPLLHRIFTDFPKLTPVNTPMGFSQFVKDYLNEAHVYKVPQTIQMTYQYSHDGLSSKKPLPGYAANGSVDCNIQKFKEENKKAIAFWYWVLQLNLKKNSKEAYKPPMTRKCKPTVELLKSIVALADEKLKVDLRVGYIYKSHSEQHNDVDPRANKPVVVTPKGVRHKKMEIWDSEQAKVIVRLTDGGITDNGEQTWRCNKPGYTLGRKAIIVADGQGIGTVDLPFRQNEYRDKI